MEERKIQENKMNLSQGLLIASLSQGFIFQTIILLYSLMYILYLMKLVKRDCIELKNAKYYAYPNSQESEKTAKQNYKKNMLILLVLVFESLYRVVGLIDYIYIASKQAPQPVPEYKLTANCTLKNGTELALYFQWGTGYNILVGANWACLVFVLSLLCLLTEYITNTMFNNSKRSKRGFMSKYIIFSIVKCVLIQIFRPIPILYTPTLVLYLCVLVTDFYLLICLTIRLYRRLKGKCIDIKYHGSVEELSILKNFEENVKSYKYFSLILMTGFAMQVVGEFTQLVVSHIIGSLFENSCFYEVFYGIGVKGRFPLEIHGIGIFSEIATHLEFFGRNLFNLAIIIAYSVYSWKRVVKMYKQVRVYRYQVVKTSPTDPFIPKKQWFI